MLISKAIEFPNLHIMIQDLPKSFNVFGLEISFYGVIIAIGMILGILFVCYEARRTGQDYNTYITFAIFAILICIVCARIYYVIFSWDYYSKNLLEIFNIRKGGLAIYGGVIGAVICAIVYSKIKKINFGLFADTAVFGLIIGQIVGRWGNFFNREAFGRVASNSNPFAMRLYFNNEFNVVQVPEKVLMGMSKVSNQSIVDLGYVQVEPTFLYESVWNLFVFIMMLIFRDKKAFNGEVLLWYLGGYSLGRFFIEGMRTDQLLIPGIGWPVSQCLSLLIFIGVIITEIVVRMKLMKKKK